jgi:hypothetical protein
MNGCIQALRDATMEMVDELKSKMSDVVYRRARHCVGEDKRTLAAVEALKAGDYKTVGESAERVCVHCTVLKCYAVHATSRARQHRVLNAEPLSLFVQAR